MKWLPVALCFLCTFLAANSGCKKDNDSIPNVTVDFYVYLSQPSAIKLNAIGGWMYADAGVRGIIIYRRSQDEFAAYERDCPYDPNATNARVEVDSSNIIGIDRNCGSMFSLSDNSIVNGPTTRSLKTYQVDYDAGGAVLHIYN